jgi:hypothetical protein
MKRSIAVLAVVALVQAPAAAGWSWPVDGPVLRPFVFGDDPYAAGQHRGIDIGAPPGTPVHAASAGTVSFAGAVPKSGRTITVETADGLSVTYLELGAVSVARGAEVVEGDAIGTVGSTEQVHLGVRLTADPHGYRDPLLYLPARVEAPARTDPVEAQPPAPAQPEPVVEPPAHAAAAEPHAHGPPTAEAAAPATAAIKARPVAPATDDSPAEATEPAEAPAAAVTKDFGADAKAEEPGDAAATARARERPVAEAESAASTRAPAAPEATTPVARAKSTVTRSKATPRPTPATVKRPLERPSRPAGASVVAAPSEKAGEPAEPVRTRSRAAAPRAVRQLPLPAQATPSRPPRRAGDRPEPSVRSSAWLDTELALASLALAMLGAAAAAAFVRRRRRPTVTPEIPSAEAVRPAETHSCSLGRGRAAHVIHSCARAREPAWLLTGGAPRRRSAAARTARTLPRPRRRVVAHAGT